MKISDEEYKNLLQGRLKNINDEINNIKARQEEARNVSISLASRLSGLEIEKQNLEEQIKNYTSMDFGDSRLKNRINNLDEKYEKNVENQKEFEDKKKELEAMKTSATTNYAKNRIQKRIDKLEHRFEKLKNKGARIKGLQRRLIMPKFRKENLKKRLIDRQIGRAREYHERMEANIELRDALNDKMFGRFTSKIYDMKAKHYKKRRERSIEILTKMQNANTIVGIRGARVTSIGKKAVDAIRKKSGAKPTLTPTPAAAPSM